MMLREGLSGLGFVMRRRLRPSVAAAVVAGAVGLMVVVPSRAAVASGAGQLYGFGANYFGELGSATNVGSQVSNPPSVVSLPGATGPVTQVATGTDFSLVVTLTGQLYAFGGNDYGDLGSATNNGTNTANPTPTLVSLPGATGPVTKVAAGGGFSLVVTSTGQLYAFGLNNMGELGNPANNGPLNLIANPTPTLVSLPGASGPVTQVSAGSDFSLVVTSTGQLYAFGDNFDGQLGSATNDGVVTDEVRVANPMPALVSLPGASGPVTEVSAGYDFSLAVTSTGQLFAFGDNYRGQLGSATNNITYTDGAVNANPTPMLVTLPGASGPVTEVSAGPGFSLAGTSTGQLYQFPASVTGPAGVSSAVPTAVDPTPALVSLPGAGGAATQLADPYVVTSTGQLYQLPNNGMTTTAALVSLPGVGPVKQIATGGLVIAAAVVAPTAAQTKASLLAQLTPQGTAATLATLTKGTGYATSFAALAAGTLVMNWYYLPKGAHLASTKAKPVLVATGKRTFSAAGTQSVTLKLTTAGKKLFKHAKRITLIVRATFATPGGPAITATKRFTLTR